MRDYYEQREKARAQLRAWLDGLKPGDEVVTRVMGEWRSREDIRRVARRTEKQIVLGPAYEGGPSMKVRAEDGRLIGARGEIRAITKADQESAERAQLITEVVRWTDVMQRDPSKVPLKVLRAVASAIKGGGGS